MSAARILGVVLAVIGVLAAIFPGWFSVLTGAATTDVFEAVERRVRGGMVLGVGLIFIAVTAWRPWSVSIPTAIFYFATGALAARILGLLVDGVVPKQWFLVAVETVIMTVVAFWLWRVDGAGT